MESECEWCGNPAEIDEMCFDCWNEGGEDEGEPNDGVEDGEMDDMTDDRVADVWEDWGW